MEGKEWGRRAQHRFVTACLVGAAIGVFAGGICAVCGAQAGRQHCRAWLAVWDSWQQVNQCWCSVRALQPHPRFVIAELPPTHSAPSWCQRCWEPWAAAWFPDWVTAPEVSPSPAPVTQDFKQGQWDKAVSRACAELPAHGGPQCLYLLESQSLSGTEMKCYYRTSWVCVGVCGFGGFA